MSFTSGFRRQHDEILEVATEISQHLDANVLKDKHKEALGLLNTLAGKLTAHLTMEDKVLYPKLLSHSDQTVKSTAQEFIDEMGGLSSVFKSYVEKWQNSDDIKNQAESFIDETKGIFDALGQRVEKENTILYPLADQ